MVPIYKMRLIQVFCLLLCVLTLNSSLIQARPIRRLAGRETDAHDLSSPAPTTADPSHTIPHASSLISILDDNLLDTSNSSDSSTSDGDESLAPSPSAKSSHHTHHHAPTTLSDSFPPNPHGATLVQLKPCAGIDATVPMFVNDLWAGNSTSTAKKAFIVTHGAARDFNNAFTDLYDIVDKEGVLVAPAFYIKNDTQKRFKPNWYQEGENLAWLDTEATEAGENAIRPSQSQCSTYSVYDALISLFSGEKYPDIEEIVFAAHSNGASQTIKYSVVAPSPPSGVKFKFAVANTPSFPYFSRDRPLAYDSKLDLEYNSWPYGLEARLSPYVKDKIGDTDKSSLFSKWASVDVRTITGDRDTFEKYPFGDISPPACIQGPSRRDRNYAYWAYRNLLAGVEGTEDIRDYWGYQSLTTLNGGVKSLNLETFKGQQCNVEGVGHDAPKMWRSDCGRSALLESKMTGGVPPRRPGNAAQCTY